MERETKMEKLMIKFLYRHYPITKRKIKTKLKSSFKRCVEYNSTIYEVNNKSERQLLFIKLTEVLMTIFDCSEIDCKLVLNKFL